MIVNALAQPLERGLGEWQAEWVPLIERVTDPASYLGSGKAQVRRAIDWLGKG